MLEKSRNAVFLNDSCVGSVCRVSVSGQSKSRPVKATGAEASGQRGHQKLHAAVAKSML